MRIALTALMVAVLGTASSGFAGQAANSEPAPTATATGVLQPSLDELQQTVAALKLDKWKGGSLRSEAGSNLSSIQKDLQATLPGLLADADTAPQTVAKLLVVYRNVNALYDVLLRVVDTAQVLAPAEQYGALQQALADLSKGRLALDDHVQEIAAAREKQVVELQVALKAAKAASVAPPVAAPTPATAPAISNSDQTTKRLNS
jgi:hypothetical protein